jgi:hypothetical protein
MNKTVPVCVALLFSAALGVSACGAADDSADDVEAAETTSEALMAHCYPGDRVVAWCGESRGYPAVFVECRHKVNAHSWRYYNRAILRCHHRTQCELHHDETRGSCER